MAKPKSNREVEFAGEISKTQTKWQKPKDAEADAERILQITLQVKGNQVDHVAKEILKFHPDEKIFFQLAPVQIDMFRDDAEEKQVSDDF